MISKDLMIRLLAAKIFTKRKGKIEATKRMSPKHKLK
jgi:hypothetical protein